MKSTWYIKCMTTVKSKLKKKRYEEVMKPTMVNFKRKFLND